jgi:hypothetical protein
MRVSRFLHIRKKLFRHSKKKRQLKFHDTYQKKNLDFLEWFFTQFAELSQGELKVFEEKAPKALNFNEFTRI